MNRIRILTSCLLLCLWASHSLFTQQVFEVNLNDRTGDTFKVTLNPEHLSASNNIFQFASTAPGTYQEMDIGRFVNDFRAYDQSGREVPVSHSSTNEWNISRPSDVKKITYTVADIWNAKVKEFHIGLMSGATLSDDFVMINGQAVFGYFIGMQTEPMRIKLDHPPAWKVGTALTPDAEGYYNAENFDKIVDSPFYLGNLSTASTTVGGAKIDVYTYSLTGLITSDTLLANLKNILRAESDFTRGLPVDRYAFLFYFGKIPAGAWEHSFSSEYVLKEDTLTPSYTATIVTYIAHEFFHVNIPLHLHSELVEHFNFVKPVMSQHLWLYEGTTEWAANILQLRDSLMTLDQYLKVLQMKFVAAGNYDSSISLTRLAALAPERQDQYPDIYMKGAIVSTLLDIRLLELSHGNMGLREVLLRLLKEYGRKRSFSEEHFFDTLVAMTYPEIGDFINRYIKGTEKLPVQEYFGWLGIDYNETGKVDSSLGSLRVGMRVIDTSIVVTEVMQGSQSGLMKDDTVKKIDGTPATFANIGGIFSKLSVMKPGQSLTITVNRNGKEMDIASMLVPRRTPYSFTINPSPTPEQRVLRKAWMENMK